MVRDVREVVRLGLLIEVVRNRGYNVSAYKGCLYPEYDGQIANMLKPVILLEG